VEAWERELTEKLEEMDKGQRTAEGLDLLAVDFTFSRRWIRSLRERIFEISAV